MTRAMKGGVVITLSKAQCELLREALDKGSVWVGAKRGRTVDICVSRGLVGVRPAAGTFGSVWPRFGLDEKYRIVPLEGVTLVE